MSVTRVRRALGPPRKFPERAGHDFHQRQRLHTRCRYGDRPIRGPQREVEVGALCGSGSWSPGPKSTPIQLYDMSVDEGERQNLEAEHPVIFKNLTA